MDTVIDSRYGWGEHIPITCRNHPTLRWSTKNIDHIGCRNIFFTTATVPLSPKFALDMIFGGEAKALENMLLKTHSDGKQIFAIECSCPIRDLEPIK